MDTAFLRTTTRWVASLVMLALLAAGPALATEPAQYHSLTFKKEPAGKVSLECHRADVNAVVRSLAKAMDVSVIVEPAVHGEVTMMLHNVKPAGALLLALTMCGFDYQYYSEKVIVVGTKATVSRVTDNPDYCDSGHFTGRMTIMAIPLQHSKAASMADTLKNMFPNLQVQVNCSNDVILQGPIDELHYVRHLVTGQPVWP